MGKSQRGVTPISVFFYLCGLGIGVLAGGFYFVGGNNCRWMMENPLLSLMDLERLDDNIFRGHNYPAPWGHVFGGQVLAQALNAAERTSPSDRVLHSMHGYFILPGDLELPIIYQVERIRDGKSFNTRRVVGIQKGRPIFNMSASFQHHEKGLVHQIPMPKVTAHRHLATDLEWMEENGAKIPEGYQQFLKRRYITFKPVEHIDFRHGDKLPPYRHIWIKSEAPVGDELSFHQQALAFASDYNLMTTTLLPHRGDFEYEQMQLASLDHAMWFHKEFSVDEWLLFAIESPSASNGRGLSKGHFFTEDGELVATVMQEGLIRQKG